MPTLTIKPGAGLHFDVLFDAHWTGSDPGADDDGHGIAGFELAVRRDAGAWKTVE